MFATAFVLCRLSVDTFSRRVKQMLHTNIYVCSLSHVFNIAQGQALVLSDTHVLQNLDYRLNVSSRLHLRYTLPWAC